MNSFVVKPLGVSPSSEKEILYIGLATGAVYRSIDNGTNWIEAGYSGSVGYPFVNFSANPNQSLPYSFDYLNMAEGFLPGQLEELKYVKKDNVSNEYSRLIVCRTGGL